MSSTLSSSAVRSMSALGLR
uniref:SCRK1 n=1 Tax=Arundo donax TaxID=35708 RepID=A0A0A9CQZ1_ARUDO